jgi:hypothetical protein
MTRMQAVTVEVLSSSKRRPKCLSKRWQAIGKWRENKRTNRKETQRKVVLAIYKQCKQGTCAIGVVNPDRGAGTG